VPKAIDAHDISMLNRIILTVKQAFPSRTKRRKVLNAIVKPVARALGFNVPADVSVGKEFGTEQEREFAGLITASEEAGTKYWESIANLLKIKTALFLSDPRQRLVFPRFERPVVSILIVTYNKSEYTFQCLETIKAYSDVPYELIIVDNASTDRTTGLLERIENATIIRNNDNVGFLRACNQGAQAAKGEFILFLNNDTQVSPNWLSRLVETARSYPGCGAVGARLVFPSGRLQEAGSTVLSNGVTCGQGRNSNPLSPDYCSVKEAEYCSGACLLVRKDLFSRLGGFDERYSPAYYEDVDLCFGIRKLGYKVVVEPEVQVLHYEFGSGSFGKAYELSIENRKKFTEKWAAELKGSHETGRLTDIK